MPCHAIMIQKGAISKLMKQSDSICQRLMRMSTIHSVITLYFNLITNGHRYSRRDKDMPKISPAESKM